MDKRKNNRMCLSGELTSNPKLAHQVLDEKFYAFDVRTLRLSGTADVLPVICSEKVANVRELKVGAKVRITGQFRSYNEAAEGHSRLVLRGLVQELTVLDRLENLNVVALNGYVCKLPVYRTTPFNREIADVLIAVNRPGNKSDYIPCVAWGRNARFASSLVVGDRVALSGRIQSRQYIKRLSETEIDKRVAYEVSIGKLVVHNTDEDFNLDQDFEEVEHV